MHSQPAGRHGRQESPTAVLAMFVPYLRRQTGKVAAAYTVSLGGVALTLLLPWPLKFLIDHVLGGQAALPFLQHLSAQQQVILLAISMLILASLAAITLGFDKILHARIRERFSYDLRDDLVQQLYRLSRFSRQKERSGELTMRLVSDTQLVSRLFCKTFPTALKHAATAILALSSILLINRPLGMVALLMAAILGSIVLRFGPRLASAATDKRSHEGRVAALTQETVKGIEHVQAMALETRSRKRYLSEAAASLQAGVQEVRIAVQLERSAQIVAGFALAAVAGVGGIAVINGQMSLGTLTVCLAYIAQLLKPIEKLNEIATSVSRGIARADRLCSLFAAETTDAGDATTAMPGRIEQIECIGLGFRYPEMSSATIRGFNHCFRRGECTAIVGPSGCGKSTLLRLILQLQSPTSGQITVNGKQYRGLDTAALRAQFAVLLQDAHLFAGTVREILTELKPDLSDDRLWQALADVQLLDLVKSMPAGLDTPLDETATRVSGGQRARLLLARALVSDRPVLLLDEPFANIDAASRQIILQRLAIAKLDHVVIVVTHEKALLKIADHVLRASELHVIEPVPSIPLNTPPQYPEVVHANSPN